MNIVEWLAFFCSTFYHILPFQIGYCFYVYRYIHVSNDENTEYFMIALRTEIESLRIQRFPTIRTLLMGSKMVQYFKTIYISILLNTGDCEIFNVEIEFPLTSNQPGGGGSIYKHSKAGQRQRAETSRKSGVSAVSPELRSC